MTGKRRTTRRQFLAGVSAKEALADVLHGGAELAAPTIAKRLLTHFSSQAMACEFAVILNEVEARRGAEPAFDALALVDQLEDQLTVYREHSEVSQLNQLAAKRPVVVEQRLFDLLQLGQQLARQTAGAFDMTAGPLAKTWGFFRRAGAIPTEEDLQAARQQTGYQLLALDAAASTVQFAKPGVEINLGAIGKGYALDRCAERLRGAGVENFLLHGGNSSLLAMGFRADVAEDDAGWPIAIRHPLRADARLGQLNLHNEGLGTSGCGNQFFRHQGKRYGHILDPRTGWPADQALAVTVVCPDATRADALATAFYVMGLDATEQYCGEHPEVGCLFVRAGERAGSVECVELGLAGRLLETPRQPNE